MSGIKKLAVQIGKRRFVTLVAELVLGILLLIIPSKAEPQNPGAGHSTQGTSETVPVNGARLSQHVQLEGEFEIIYQDQSDGRHNLSYSLKLADGHRMPLNFLKEPPTHLQTGDHVRVSGETSGGSLVLYSGSTDVTKTTGATVSATPLPNTFGPQSTLLILVNFQDNALVSCDPVAAWNTFSNADTFFAENSYGQTSVTGMAVGCYTIPESITTCNTSAIATDAENAATADGVDLSHYTHHVYLFPHSGACGFGGASTVGGNPSQTWLNGTLDADVVNHELGHALGLWHSHSLDCGTTATICSNGIKQEYGDQYDVMGVVQTATPHYNAFQKERLGWLNYGNSPYIQTVTTSGTYTITPYENGAGPNALKILKSTDPTTHVNTWYYLEARQAIGFDSFLTAFPYSSTQNETTGVLFHVGTDGDGNSSFMLYMNPSTSTSPGSLDTSLAVGQNFSDPAAGVTFTPTAVDSTGATVEIAFGSGCATAAPSVGPLSPADTSIYPGGTATYTGSVTNNDSSGCSSRTINISSTQPSGWSTSLSASSITLKPGQSATITMGKGAPSGTAPGTYTVNLNATTSTESAAQTANATVLAQPSLSVGLAVSGSAFTSGQKVSFTAAGLSGGVAAAGATVTFTLTRADGKKVSATATADATGTAMWAYRISRKDPKGAWSAVAQDSYNSLKATSNMVTFTVQ